MDGLMARRRLLKSKLTRVKSKIEHETAQTWDAATAEIHDQQITELRKEFNSLFDEIMSSCPVNEEEVHIGQYLEIADRFDEVKVAVKIILARVAGTESHSSKRRLSDVEGTATSAVTMKLPKLETPTFSGNLLEWTTFKDLFVSSIHNHPTLRGSEKLSYLKGCLKGSPADLLQPFSISDANYKEAWATLIRRYHNTRELIKTHLNRLIDMPALERESGVELRRIVDTSSSVVRALRALERPIDEDSDLAMFLITSKLDSETHKLWETKIGRERIPKLAELLEFLDDRAIVLCSSEFGKMDIKDSSPVKTPGSSKKLVHAHQTNSNDGCLYCAKSGHVVANCKKFMEATVAERRAKVQEVKLCYKCLRQGHTAQRCFSNDVCMVCKGAHHSLLHIPKSLGTDARNSSNNNMVTTHIAISKDSKKQNRALMMTALVDVEDAEGKMQEFRALLDPGSDVSFISDEAVQLLKLERKNCDVGISGVGGCVMGSSDSSVTIGLRSHKDDEFAIQVDAHILKVVTTMLPKRPVDDEEVGHLKNLPLADPKFKIPGCIDLLLGADVFFDAVRCGRVTGKEGHPTGLMTVWGYAVGGRCQSQSIEDDASVNHASVWHASESHFASCRKNRLGKSKGGKRKD